MNELKSNSGSRILLLMQFCLLACSDGSTANAPDAAIIPDTRMGDGSTVDVSAGDLGPPDPFRKSVETAMKSISSDWLKLRVEILAADDMEGRDNLLPGGEKARDYLIAELAAMGVVPYGMGEWTQAFDKGVNVIGEIAGKDPLLSKEYVLLGAHYDHLGPACGDINGDTICNGATDNATGVAAVLGVAQALLNNVTGTRRSILIVFWDAEEDGLLGSKYYVNSGLPVALDSIVAVVNIDTVGTTIIPGVDSSFAIGSEYATNIRPLIHANSKTSNYVAHAVSSFFDGSDGNRGSDHLPFRKASMPVVWYAGGTPAEYHTPADEVNLVDWPKLAGVTRHALLTTADLANTQTKPEFVTEPKPHIDDAVALLEMAEVALQDPGIVSRLNESMLDLAKQWVEKLQDYVQSPPQTEAEWDEYQTFLKGIIALVYTLLV
jgi:hypothetical protein